MHTAATTHYLYPQLQIHIHSESGILLQYHYCLYVEAQTKPSTCDDQSGMNVTGFKIFGYACMLGVITFCVVSANCQKSLSDLII